MSFFKTVMNHSSLVLGWRTISIEWVFLVSYVGERPWWPIQNPNKGRKRMAKRRERSNFIDLRFERWQLVRLRKARGRQDVP